MTAGRKRETGWRTARALPALLLLWLPFPAQPASAPADEVVLPAAPPPVSATESARAGGPVAPSQTARAAGWSGLAALLGSAGALPRGELRAVGSTLPAIRTAPPGRPGRPNLSRAPPDRA